MKRKGVMKQMKITKKQYDDLIQAVDDIMRVNRELNNNLVREQLSCVYHIFVTLLDIRDLSGKKITNKERE